MNKQNHFELACKKLKLDHSKLPDTSGLLEEFAKPIIALYKLMVIAKAWNGKWVANWDDYSQYKWFPWFYMNQPGFRFYGTYCAVTGSDAAGGSRLCFASEKLANKAGKELDYLYVDLFGGKLPEKKVA